MARRRGILGKLRNVSPGCYARGIIDGCEGPLSEEHPLSEGLRRGRRIQVVVKEPGADGAWRETFASPSIPMRHASAKILCVKHNGALSAADLEVQKFQEALQEIELRSQSPIVWPAKTVVINGRLLGQFLCKYIVGSFVIHDPVTPVKRDLVLFAFGRKTDRPVHFYFVQSVGDRPGFGRTDNAPIQRIESPDDPQVAHIVTVAGFRTIVTSLSEGEALLPVLMEMVAPGVQWINRLAAIESPLKGEMYRVTIDWRDDPCHFHVLDVSGRIK
jgi:hypothetical protein